MLDRAGFVGADGPTHHGLYDLTYLRMIPNMTIMVPRDGKELRAMMEKMCANVGQEGREGNRWFGAVAEAPAFFSIVTGKSNAWLEECLKEYRLRDKEYFDKEGSYLKEPESHAYYGMAIISLYQATGDEYFKKLAQKFMDIRGMPATGQRTWPKFAAQHRPVEKMNEPGGHAGSFGWFAAALVDVARSSLFFQSFTQPLSSI